MPQFVEQIVEVAQINPERTMEHIVFDRSTVSLCYRSRRIPWQTPQEHMRMLRSWRTLRQPSCSHDKNAFQNVSWHSLRTSSKEEIVDAVQTAMEVDICGAVSAFASRAHPRTNRKQRESTPVAVVHGGNRRWCFSSWSRLPTRPTAHHNRRRAAEQNVDLPFHLSWRKWWRFMGLLGASD